MDFKNRMRHHSIFHQVNEEIIVDLLKSPESNDFYINQVRPTR